MQIESASLESILSQASDRFDHSLSEIEQALTDSPTRAASLLGRREAYEWFAEKLTDTFGLIVPPPKEDEGDAPTRLPVDQVITEDVFKTKST